MNGEAGTNTLLLFCPNCERWVSFTVAAGAPPPALQCSCGAAHPFDPARTAFGADRRRRLPSRRTRTGHGSLARVRIWRSAPRPAGAGGG
jgi:hypothetical protein